MIDPMEISVSVVLNEQTGADRFETLLACQGVRFVLGKEHDLPGADLDHRLTLEADKQFTRNDDVIGNDLSMPSEEGRAVGRLDPYANAPWRGKVPRKKDTSLQPNRAQYFRQRVHRRIYP